MYHPCLRVLLLRVLRVPLLLLLLLRVLLRGRMWRRSARPPVLRQRHMRMI